MIPPRAKEGNFATRDGRRNPKEITIGNRATKGPR
jgi:hypothetical protein